MSWLSSFVNNNRNFAGNLAKNVAPALSFVPGVGWLGAAAIGALGQGVQKGSNIGDIAKAGLSAGSIGAGLQGAAQAATGAGYLGGTQGALAAGANQGAGALGGTLRNAFGGTGTAGTMGTAGVTAPTMGSTDNIARMVMGPDGRYVSELVDNGGMMNNLFSGVTKAAKGAGSFAKKSLGTMWEKDPATTLKALQGIASIPAINRQSDAEAQLLQQQADTQGLTAEQLRRQQAQLAALRASMATSR